MKYTSAMLIASICLLLSTAAHAQTPGVLAPCTSNCKPIGGVTTGEVVGVIVGVAAAVTVVTILVIHHERSSHEARTISGCVNSTPAGMSMTDDKDKRTYTLSGDTASIKPGERYTLQGKKINPSSGKPLIWDITSGKTLGVCQP